MAAETSGDAYIPVSLALLKLGLFYGVDVFSKEVGIGQKLLQYFKPKSQNACTSLHWK